MTAAGFEPGNGGANAVILDLHILNYPQGAKLTVSYYNSIREGAGRIPEARMGEGLAVMTHAGGCRTAS